MTWQEAKREARKRLPSILARINGLKAVNVPLSWYPSPVDYARIWGKDAECNWEEQRMVTQAMQRLLKRKGHRAVLVDIEAAAYFEWLVANGVENGPEARAEYIAWAGAYLGGE